MTQEEMCRFPKDGDEEHFKNVFLHEQMHKKSFISCVLTYLTCSKQNSISMEEYFDGAVYTNKIRRSLPPADIYIWDEKTNSLPYTLVLVENIPSMSSLLKLPMYHQETERTEVLQRISSHMHNVLAVSQADKKRSIMLVLVLRDDLFSIDEPSTLVYFSSQTLNNILSFSLRDCFRKWSTQSSKMYLESIYWRHLRHLQTQEWNHAFVSPEQSQSFYALCTSFWANEHPPMMYEAMEHLIHVFGAELGDGIHWECLSLEANQLINPRVEQGLAGAPTHILGVHSSELVLGYWIITYGGAAPEEWGQTVSENHPFSNILVMHVDQEMQTVVVQLWNNSSKLSYSLHSQSFRLEIEQASTIISRFFSLRRHVVCSPKELTKTLAYKAVLLQSISYIQLQKEWKRYQEQYNDTSLFVGDDRCRDFPLLELYWVFHIRLMTLEKNDSLEERNKGFAVFADMFAQTISYGLLAAHWMSKDNSASCTRKNIDAWLPSTSDFLKNTFVQLLEVNASPEVNFCIKELCSIFYQVNVHKSFERDRRDPVIHFYEDFLALYDQGQRQDRGVYYTPYEVVDFIVRSIDEQLKSDFGLPLGLASTRTWDEVLIYLNRGVEESTRIVLPQNAKKGDFFVRILDPATGTGTFIKRVFEQIRKNLKVHWRSLGWSTSMMRVEWNAYVSGSKGVEKDYTGQGLLSRVNAFELMLAPYIINHLRMGLLLQEDEELPFSFSTTGAGRESTQRLNVFLTNALERPEDRSFVQGLCIEDSISEESKKADQIKKDAAMTVVLGNPPYNARSNRPYPWFDGCKKTKREGAIEEYKYVDGIHIDETKHWLSDEYVKFMKMGERLIQCSGVGILGFINPHGILDNPTFRGMRWYLLNFYTNISVVDLHGNVRRREVDEYGEPCQNVFSIQTGVGINIFTRSAQPTQRAAVWHAELKGKKESKLRALQDGSLHWEQLRMSCYSHSFDHCFFVPKDFVRDVHKIQQYTNGVCVIDLFRDQTRHCRAQRFSSGIITSNDALLVQMSEERIRSDMRRVLSPAYTAEQMQQEFGTGKTYVRWFFKKNKRGVSKHSQMVFEESRVIRLVYRPFDFRYTYYHPWVIHQPRVALMENLRHRENLAIVFSRTVQGDDDWRDVQVTDSITEFGIMATRVGNAAPICSLFRYEGDLRYSNVNREKALELIGHYGLPFDEYSMLSLQEQFCTGTDIIYYIFAVLSSPKYRKSYQELLKIGYPFVPVQSSLEVFRQLVRKGKELRHIQLLESDCFLGLPSKLRNKYGVLIRESKEITQLRAKRPTKIEAKKCEGWNGQIWINDTQYFEGVSERVWNFYIGGYQPAKKWLKDRKKTSSTAGIELSYRDVIHYSTVIKALEETDRVMKEIDTIDFL